MNKIGLNIKQIKFTKAKKTTEEGEEEKKSKTRPSAKSAGKNGWSKGAHKITSSRFHKFLA